MEPLHNLHRSPGRPRQAERPAAVPTRDAILEAATHLFLERGFTAVSLSAIAASSHLAKASLYHYFPGKNELFTEAMGRLVARIIEGTRHLLAKQESHGTRLLELTQVAMSASTAEYGVPVLLRQAEAALEPGQAQQIRSAWNDLHNVLSDFFAEGMRAGAFAKADPKFAAYSYVALLRVIDAVDEHRVAFFPASEETAANLVNLFCRGLSAD